MSAGAIATRGRRSRRRLSIFGRLLYGIFAVVFLCALFAIGTVAGVVYSYSRHLPDINRMADFQPSRSTRIYARDSEQLATIYTQNRIWVPIARVPQLVRHAFVANEDHNFYQHHGVDFGGIARAALADYRHQRLQGASTITQQLARALFLSNEVSISRKIQEALLAMEIERYYTKDEILERYLNLIYFGAGAYGIQAASHTYFGTDVARLSLGQMAMLAGLPAAPSDYSPYVSIARARDRQHHVLERMVASGYVSQRRAAAAVREPLGLIGDRPTGLQSFRFPYFTTYVQHVLQQTFGAQSVNEGGLEVDTTLDPHLQKLAQDAVDWGVGRARVEGIGAHQAALVAIRPQTGEILAMVGGAGGFTLQNQFNRAWQAERQPGSSFKAYVYTTAIDSGLPPTTQIDDSPVSYPMGDGTQWHPMNDDFRFFGPMTLRTALAQSRNVVAVKLAQQLGIDRVIAYAHRMGVRAPLEANLSLALGSSVVSPLDQAAGYATLANEGIHIDPSPIRLVRDAFGSTILDNRVPQETEVVSAGTAYVVTSMLESVIKEGTGFPNADLGRPAAGKTGTTSDFRDAWFVGYTPELVTAVWLGNDNYARMNESFGGNIPARTWARFMKAALAHVPKREFTYPATEVRKLAYCGQAKKFEYFLDGTQPHGACAYAGWAGPHALMARPESGVRRPVVGVKRLADYLRRKIEGDANLRAVDVRGEVSNYSVSPRGHANFDLKEGDAILRCFAFGDDATRFPAMKNGVAIVATGSVTTYAQKSSYQLVVRSVEREGLGDVYVLFEERKRKLAAEGFFAVERKRRLPAYPFRIALVSSRAANGALDFTTILRERAPHVAIVWCETSVQGPNAPAEIVAALGRASREDVDAIVLTRGGGSFEDLFTFSDEQVVRAVARARHPVISAIGHTADQQLSDFAADLHVETPSAAAKAVGIDGRVLRATLEERVRRARSAVDLRCERLGGRLSGALVRSKLAEPQSFLAPLAQRMVDAETTLAATLARGIGARETALRALGRRLDARDPTRRLAERERALQAVTFRLAAAGQARLETSRRRRAESERRLGEAIRASLERSARGLALSRAHLDGKNPEAILQRGYAIVTYRGIAVRDATTLAPGAEIEARVARGRLVARVERGESDGNERIG